MTSRLNKLNEKIQKLNKSLFEKSKAESKNPVVTSTIPQSSIERAHLLEANRSGSSKNLNDITSISVKKSHVRNASNSSAFSANPVYPSHHKSKTIYDTKAFKNSINEFSNNVDKKGGTKSAFSTHRSVKQSPYMTMRQNTMSDCDNVDIAMLKTWDKQKTLPSNNNRQSSSKKRKTDSKKSERKSERKT